MSNIPFLPYLIKTNFDMIFDHIQDCMIGSSELFNTVSTQASKLFVHDIHLQCVAKVWYAIDLSKVYTYNYIWPLVA